MDVLVVWVIAIVAICWIFHIRQNKERMRDDDAAARALAQARLAAVVAYVNRINRERAYPALPMNGVQSRPGEFAILHEPAATMRQFAAAGAPAVTAQAAAAIPAAAAGNELRVAAGELYLTNSRIVFAGNGITESIAVDARFTLDALPQSIRCCRDSLAAPLVFGVANSALWGLLANLVASSRLATPQLQNGVMLELAQVDGAPGELKLALQPSGD